MCDVKGVAHYVVVFSSPLFPAAAGSGFQLKGSGKLTVPVHHQTADTQHYQLAGEHRGMFKSFLLQRCPSLKKYYIQKTEQQFVFPESVSTLLWIFHLANSQ